MFLCSLLYLCLCPHRKLPTAYLMNLCHGEYNLVDCPLLHNATFALENFMVSLFNELHHNESKFTEYPRLHNEKKLFNIL